MPHPCMSLLDTVPSVTSRTYAKLVFFKQSTKIKAKNKKRDSKSKG